MIKSELCNEKSRAIIHCDLFRASWLNFKNSKEKLIYALKTIDNPGLDNVLETFHKDFDNINVIQEDINMILREIDTEIGQVNDILKENQAPYNIIANDLIDSKFEWMLNKFGFDIDKLKQINGDVEDRLTSLQNDNHQIHLEFKTYMNRTQPLIDEMDLNVLRFKNIEEKCQTLEERFAESENECIFLKSTVEELNQQIILYETQIKNLELKVCNSLYDETLKCDENGILISKKCQYCLNTNSPKQISYIKKLTEDLAALSDRYSQKRERHRQQLLEARSTYQQKIQELTDNANENKNIISNISENLRITQLRLKQAIHEKSLLIANITKLENGLTNSKNEVMLHCEKILQFEKQMTWIKTELLNKPDVIPT